jgi:hypothetical protein
LLLARLLQATTAITASSKAATAVPATWTTPAATASATPKGIAQRKAEVGIPAWETVGRGWLIDASVEEYP